jgi:hypothetical protein
VDGEFDDAAEGVLGPGRGGGISGEAKRRVPGGEVAEAGLEDEPRKVGAEAVVGAGAERVLLAGRAGDVELVGAVDVVWVFADGVEADTDNLAGVDVGAATCGWFDGEAHGAGDGWVEAQQLGDGAGCGAGRVGGECRPGVWGFEQVGESGGDRLGGGVDASEDEVPGESPELAGGEAVAVVGWSARGGCCRREPAPR